MIFGQRQPASLALAWALVACASPVPPAPASRPVETAVSSPAATPAATPPELGAPPGLGARPPLVLACEAHCQRRQMMRAVGAAMIERACAEGCADVLSAPVITTRAALAAHEGQAVRAQGVVVGAGVALQLAGAGAPLPCALDGAVEGQVIEVAATVEGEGLVNVRGWVVRP
jgi:hypothetical protein